MPEMTQNGENLVKVSTNQSGKMRNFFKKVAKGLKNVLYAPGAIFETLKDVPKAAKYRITSKIEEQEKLKEKDLKSSKIEVNKTTESNKNGSSKDVDLPESVPTTEVDTASKNEPLATEKSEKDDTEEEKLHIIQGKSYDDFIKKTSNNSKDDSAKKDPEENEPAHAVEIDKPSKPTQQPQEEPDTSVLDNSIKSYGDLRQFASWEEYYNSFSEKERMKQMKNGDFLTDSEFSNARLFQAKETIRLCEAKEAIRQAEKTRLLEEENTRQKQKEANQNEKKDLKDRIKEIDEEQARLTTESRKNKSQVRALDKQSQEDEKLKSNMKKITEPKTEEKTKEEKIEDEVERRMNKINSNSEANKTLPHESSDEKTTSTLNSNPAEPQVADDKKEMASKLVNAINQIVEQKTVEDTKEPNTDSKNASNSIAESTVKQDNQEDSLVSELSNFESPTKVETENKSNDNSTVLVSTNPDYPGNITINNDKATVDWGKSPINNTNATFNNDDFYMGFDPKTRSELGVEAYNRYINSDGNITFDDAKSQVANEYEQSEKGKTR